MALPGILDASAFQSKVIFKIFIWGKSRHKLPWGKLKNPTNLGGTALPDLNMYYIAAHLSQPFHIDKTDRARFLTFLCLGWSHSTGDSLVSITGRVLILGQAGDRTSLLHHCRCIWDLATAKLQLPLLHKNTSLWHNVALPEFYSIPDSELWRSKGVFYLSHLNSNGELKVFNRLRTEHILSTHVFQIFSNLPCL